MGLRDSPIVMERGKITARQFAGKDYEDDDVWAFVTKTWPNMSTEMTQQVESAAWREMGASARHRTDIVAGYYAVRDKATALMAYVRGLSKEDAVVLHDYLAGKTREKKDGE